MQVRVLLPALTTPETYIILKDGRMIFLLKKGLLCIMLLLSLVFVSSASASTLKVNPPWAVGNYNDFGKQVELNINPKYSNAAKFTVYYAKGYSSKSGFKHFTVSATPNYLYYRYQYVVRTGFQATDYGWWTVEVVSVGADGSTSKPFITNVNVIR